MIITAGIVKFIIQHGLNKYRSDTIITSILKKASLHLVQK